MNIQILLIILLVAMTIGIVISRFLRGAYGTLRLNREVGHAFEHFQVKDHLHYYTSGPDTCPQAIIGIDKAWTLQSDLWLKRELTTETMKGLVSRMLEKNQILHGFDIMDHQDHKIGDWYSVLEPQTTIKITGAHQVVISTPPLDMAP